MQKTNLTALYERLSREEGENQESNSIATQKRILESYAIQHGLTPFRHWSDDGFSGKDFNRPAFQEMLSEIEKGDIDTVIVKELDRFGRSYLESGLYRETFRKLGVRFISVAEGHDSFKGEDDFTPFREVINEFYLHQYSKKIKAAFRARGLAGKHTSSCPPYGYLKSPTDKNQWIIDRKAANVVRRIFQLTLEGNGPYRISRILEAEKVEIPGAHLARKGLGLHQHKTFQNPYHWSSSTVCSILRKREYLGHTVNFKSAKSSYKDKRNRYLPESEWLIFENTHAPIIDQTTFDIVQRIRSNVRRRPDGWGFVHPLTGLVFCADCGGKLYIHRVTNGKDNPQYVCGNYGKTPCGTRCKTPHRISAESLFLLIQASLKEVLSFAQTDTETFAKTVLEKLSSQELFETELRKKQLAGLKNRRAELELLFRRIYEDRTLGKLSEKQFSILSDQYEQEIAEIDKTIPDLQLSFDCIVEEEHRASRFMKLVRRYSGFDELTPTMLNEFIEKIVVHERERKGSINARQSVEIHFNFIGTFSVPKDPPDPATVARQEEEQRRIEVRRDQLHQNYLKRKARMKQTHTEAIPTGINERHVIV